MEHLEYEFGPFTPAAGAADTLVGVVGSGNMEVLFEPRALGGMIRFVIDTSISGFDPTWRAVLEAFAEGHRVGDLLVTINDAGATPSVVALRLAQAAEELGV
ncbi:malonate decarboxylase acyl carrier protein [Methylibium sp.]|uniref:malonate decarboxylase acyl carrier protein n=1 Tax=Methylibium sp. TaxID=2067992 RepID=UPI001843B78C|nr:malonate decarboxylase acyl carrier protein [Methylibium sp.]MBA3591687.1 malonate decarboxylase acyl carrier protein [Methylibium sp.]